MSYPLGHFSLGALIALVSFRVIDYFSKRVRTEAFVKYDIIAAGLGGFWATIPDLPHLFGIKGHLINGAFCNAFLFHCLLDKLDPNDSVIVTAVLFGAFLTGMLLITLTTVRKRRGGS